jgi:hypothetical protein
MGASGGEGGAGGEGGEGGEGTCNGTCTYECDEEDLCAGEAQALATAKEKVSEKQAEIDALTETIATLAADAAQWDSAHSTLVGEVAKVLAWMNAANQLSPDSTACLSALSDIDPTKVVLEMCSGLPVGALALLGYDVAKDGGIDSGKVGHFAVHELAHAAVHSADAFVEGLNESACNKFQQGTSKTITHKTFGTKKGSCHVVYAAAVAVYTFFKYQIQLSECEAAFGEFTTTSAAQSKLQGKLNELTALKAAAKAARDAALADKAAKEAEKTAKQAELLALQADADAAQDDLDDCEDQMSETEYPACALVPDGGTCAE